MKQWARLHPGFTVVELLIVMVVIGILATITIVGYNGIQNRAAFTAVKADLTNAKNVMEIARAQNKGQYPVQLPPDITSSENVTITKVPITVPPHYTISDPVQYAVLFTDICQDLLDEGLGRNVNMGGGTDNYIQQCQASTINKNQFNVTGWGGNGKLFTTPVTLTAYNSFVNGIPAGDAWHPNQQSTVKNFYTQLRDRYVASGGSFPITSFWDHWASPGNGTPRQDLPEPDNANIGGISYCIQAIYKNKADFIWHLTEAGDILEGSCE